MVPATAADGPLTVVTPAGGRFVSPESFTILAPQVLAEQRIRERYEQLGGILSPLGLELSPGAGVQYDGQTYFMDFRGGRIDIQDLSGPARETLGPRVQVWWRGLECRVRQESVDEVYGSVGVILPSLGFDRTIAFPSGPDFWEMGPDGLRIIQTDQLIYEGPPMDLVFAAWMMEGTTGNTPSTSRWCGRRSSSNGPHRAFGSRQLRPGLKEPGRSTSPSGSRSSFISPFLGRLSNLIA